MPESTYKRNSIVPHMNFKRVVWRNELMIARQLYANPQKINLLPDEPTLNARFTSVNRAQAQIMQAS